MRVLAEHPVQGAKLVVWLCGEHSLANLRRLVTRLIDEKTETAYYSGSSYAVPNSYYGGYYPYYSSSYMVMSSPGYTVENTTVSLETNLYEVSGGKLIWSGLTDTLLSGDLLGDIGDVIKVLVDEMAREKLVE